MALKFKVEIPSDFAGLMQQKQRPLIEAATAALRQTAANAVDEGRSDIASAGRFTGGWVSGLKYRMLDEDTPQAKAIIFHTIGLAGVFERGATIRGKPIMFLPMRPDLPHSRRVRRGLTLATVHGRPMLFDPRDRDRHRKPLYVGVPSVRIPKKWHITDIVKKHVDQFAALFLRLFKGD
jgi:hypothetical protein